MVHKPIIRLFSVGVLVGVLVLVVGMGSRPSLAQSIKLTQQTKSAPAVQILRSDESVLKLNVSVGELTQETVLLNGISYDALSIDGYDNQRVAGAPALPQKSLALAVPVGATAELAVSAGKTRVLRDINPAPAPEKVLVSYDSEDDSAAPLFEDSYPINRSAYQAGGEWATLSESRQLRDLHVAQLTLSPVQMTENGVQIAEELEITIRFKNAETTGLIRPESAVFDQIFAETLINYDSAQTWRSAPALPATVASSPCVSDAVAWRVGVNKTGMHKISAGNVPNLGSIPINKLRMCHMGDEIAVAVNDNNGNNVFDATDTVIFYGEALKTHDTETNIYWLSRGSVDGVRISVENSPPSGTPVNAHRPTVIAEEDTMYFPNIPKFDEDGLYDHWFGGRVGFGSSLPTDYEQEITLSGVNGASAVTISAEVWGWNTFKAHKFKFIVNGTVVGPERAFSDSGEEGGPNVLSLSITANDLGLRNGTNTIGIRAINNGQGAGTHTMLVNWLSVNLSRQLKAESNHLVFTQENGGMWQYDVNSFGATPLVYDVTTAHAPVRITGAIGGDFSPISSTTYPATYALSTPGALYPPSFIEKDTRSNLADSSRSADYIIITDPTLASSLQPLVNHRQNQGLDVEVVYVQDIFDEFGYGMYSTQAIRDFLYFAYTEWTGGNLLPIPSVDTPPVSYVLLAGDASYDHRNVLGQNGSQNLVPVYLRSGIDYFIGEAAADNQYVSFDRWPGHGELPFMLLGRLPAQNDTEMRAMVNKIISYDQTASRNWHGSHLITSDNARRNDGNGCAQDPAAPNEGNSFFDITDRLIDNHIRPFDQYIERFFYAQCHENDPLQRPEYVFSDLDFGTSVAAALNDGQLITSYVGHSGTTAWAHEQILDVNTLNQISNTGKPTIMLPMTCLDGQYHRPDLTHNGNPVANGMSESLLKMNNKGAIASYAPTGLSVTTGHDLLIEGFYDAVYGAEMSEIGPAIFLAKMNLYNNGASFQDLHDTFMLLGDPATEIPAWQQAEQLYLPILNE